MASARERVRAAEAALAAEFPSVAVSAAYYAVLYAARAALSEEDRNARTHRGIWSLVGERLVSTGRIDVSLFRAVRRIQELREAADYDARELSAEQAQKAIADAEQFVTAVAAALAE